MPDVDGAHGFLTALIPLHTDPCARTDGTLTSPAHAVRELLARLPTAQHSPECVSSRLQSPFARSPVTHFARFCVIDVPAFNGKKTQDAILTALGVGPDLMAEPTVDYLERPYLLFCADFDVERDTRSPTQHYLRDLWNQMPDLWPSILIHCEGWRSDGDANAFADYVVASQIETTMPFNDYAICEATAGIPPILIPALLAVVSGIAAAGISWAALPSTEGLVPKFIIAFWAVGVLLIVLVCSIFWMGRRSSPWSSDLDLKTVLKALHLQAQFTQFAIDNQGSAPSDLQAAFRTFVEVTQPLNLDGPTQLPGVVPSAVPQ